MTADVVAIADRADIAQDLVQERFTTTLRAFVGQGRMYSVQTVAEATGIPYTTMRSYHEGRSLPTLRAWLQLIAVLPPGFCNAVTEQSGLTGAHRIDGPAPTPHDVLSHMCQEAAQLARELADGHLDHKERREIYQRLPDLIETLQSFKKQMVGSR